jgi:tetratricopeptide (TPR) repeat protein
MAIKGSLREASLADVCQLLALGQKSGCLSVADGSRFGQIYFDRGRITYARIVNRRDRLGDILVRDGMLAQTQLDEVLQRQAREPDRRVGELLVGNNYITHAQLTRFIRLQIEEAIYHLFTWSRGNFFFEVDAKPDEADIIVSINPETLLLEAARRVDEWSLIEKKIPAFDLLFDVERERLEQAGVELTPEQQRLIPLMDGTRTVQELVDDTGLTEFEAGKALFGLIQAGFAHRVGRKAEETVRLREAERQERRNLGVAFYRTGMFEDAAREFERVLELEEEAEKLLPGKPLTELSRAITLVHAHSFEAARESFERYRTLLRRGMKPAADYFYYCALNHAILNDLNTADAVIGEALDEYADSPPLLLLSGMVSERRGDLDDADRCYRQVLLEDASMAQAHKNLGDICYRRGAHDEALNRYLRAAEVNPELGDDLFAKIGNLLYKSRRVDAAVEHWRKALRLNPNNIIVHNNLQTAGNVAPQ